MPPGRKVKNSPNILRAEYVTDNMEETSSEAAEGGEVTYFVDEEGRYYYRPAGSDQRLVSLPAALAPHAHTETGEASEAMIVPDGGDESESYQTVTLVPSEAGSGEVSYVFVVQEDTKPVIEVDDVKPDREQQEEGASDVYAFPDEEAARDEASGEEELADRKRRKQQRHVFTCNLCTYRTHRRYLLLRHMKSHSEERPHKCTVCERGFKTIASLQNHVNMHNGVKPHVCKYCASPFTTSGELVRHVRYKHTHEKPHRCSECDYASVELSKLRRHVRCHTGERPYQCPHCTYASPDTFKLKRHLRTHTGEKPYKCDMCNMCFTQSNSLKSHRLIHNVAERPVYKCELCPTKCGRKTDLRIHIQNLHTSDKPLKCKRCGKCFPDRYSCKQHNKTHEGEKCYKCQLCPYASTTLRHLKSHLLKHTDEKPFACDQCDHTFRQKTLLRRHQNLYHNPEYVPKPPKEKTHTCHECQRTFAHKGNLIRHLAVHDPESGHRERALALKLGRQKRVKLVEAQPSAGEVMTVSDGEGQQYVVLEVIQLDDGSEQQVAVVAPDYIALHPDEEEEGDAEPEEETEEVEEVEVQREPARASAPALKVEDEVDACFGFDEEDEQDEEVFCNKMVYDLA